ncbi:DUF1707 SHOCT-like domain-containing protein [Propionibacteriaceae bacterium G1746]|uniref:DUF1707 SHOCT-like domain-containing protein n=1 Tax=Aestuariimicrobium sp. G57 TaxID=3418485 RepID=UPI003C1DF57D
MTSEPSNGGDNRHLRIGITEREHALDVLRNAAADDRITFDELEARVPVALNARTRGDLAQVLHDLVPVEDLDGVLGDASSAGEGPGYTWDDPVRLQGGSNFDEVTIEGPWHVPPFLEVASSWGGARLDFTQATTRTKVIDLVLMASAGTATIIVPEGWGVDSTAFQAERTTMEQRNVWSRPDKGMPRIVLRGHSSGAVKVRRTSERDRKRVAKKLAKGTLTRPLAIEP